MIKNLKTLAALACFTVAAAADSQASTILQQVNVAVNVYSQASTNANKPGTVVTEKVKISALNTKTIIQALAPGASPKAKLLEYTDYGPGSGTNVTGYAYSVQSVIYSNGVAIDTTTNGYTNSLATTNGSFTFTVDYTNNSVGGVTNPVVSVLVTNTATTNYTFSTNYGGPISITNTVSAPTVIYAPTGIVLLDNGYEIDDGGVFTVLTNTVLFPAIPGVTNVGNSNTYAAFSITPVMAATSELNGAEKAVGGTPFGDADSGRSYDLDTITVNSPGVWTIRLEAFANGAVSTLNIGGDTKKNPPSYIDYTNTTWNAIGYGFIGGAQSTSTNIVGTNSIVSSFVTNSFLGLLKGTISESLYHFAK